MKTSSMGTVLAMVSALLFCRTAAASEIIVASIPFKAPLDQIATQFERETGHKVIISYAPSEPLRQRIEAGETFDVVLTFPGIVDELISRGRVAAATRADIARAGLGLAVKKGAAKPDVRTADEFKRALLEAGSIAYAAQGPSGVHLMNVVDRLGVAQQVKPKLKPMGAGSLVVAPVAAGEAEIGIVAIPFILAHPGTELAGPLPVELQDYVRVSAGIGASARDKTAAAAFVASLRRAEAIAVLRSHGLEAAEAP